MQIRITDVSLDTLLSALENGGFSTVCIGCETRHQVETVSIFTENAPEGPGGYEVGLVRREMATFPRYEMILETDRIEVSRLTMLVERIALGLR